MAQVSSDHAKVNPDKDDRLGRAPFAKLLANSICAYRGSDGLVMALYGEWGSGKSTILNFVQHELRMKDEADRPIIVTFNPWWFSGQENLALTFLGQMRAALPNSTKRLRQLANYLGEYAEGLGGLYDVMARAGGAGTVVGKMVSHALRRPTDVATAKNRIVENLKGPGQRILVVVDDIDRLAPDETHQVFTVIKAMADFPNVIYLLAFDRAGVAEAINKHLRVNGTDYLDKIVQVPFEVPLLDKLALENMLFTGLEGIMGGGWHEVRDGTDWFRVFHFGVSRMVRVPRDVVRLLNVLSITYPPLAGEVSPTDFIAIEALRVLKPDLYAAIRGREADLAGGKPEGYSKEYEQKTQALISELLGHVPESLRETMGECLRHLFPKLQGASGGESNLSEWRKRLQVCSPEHFPIYFRWSLALGAMSEREFLDILARLPERAAFEERMLRARDERRGDGHYKIDELLQKLRDHAAGTLNPVQAETVLFALLNVGDDLVPQAGTVVGREGQLQLALLALLDRVDQSKRGDLLSRAVRDGGAIGVQKNLIYGLSKGFEKRGGFEGADPAGLECAKATWVGKVRDLAERGDWLIKHPELMLILEYWKEWGDAAEVKAWCERVTKSDDGMLQLLTSFAQQVWSLHSSAPHRRERTRLNPKWLEPYLDIEALVQRLEALENSGAIPEFARAAVSQFIMELEMVRSGKDPDAPLAFLD